VVGPRPEKAVGLKNYPKCDEEVKSSPPKSGAIAMAKPAPNTTMEMAA